jgi:dolichol-phosphate mannosyltransferase
MSGPGPCALSVIISTLNEAECIGRAIVRVEKALDRLAGVPSEIIVVDDESNDPTVAVAQAVGHRFGNVRILRRSGRRGLGSAIRDGMATARGECVLAMDGDLQHPPEAIPGMYRALQAGSQMVIMSRYCATGGCERTGAPRRARSRMAVGLTHLLLPETRAVTDPVSGYFIVRASSLDGLPLDPLGFKLLPELLVKGRFQQVTELPYLQSARRWGRSKMDLAGVLRFFRLLVRLRLNGHGRTRS